MSDHMATPGMIADALRPLVLAHGDAAPPETITVPTGTLTAAYMHLEHMAAERGEETEGHRAWAAAGNPISIEPTHIGRTELGGDPIPA